MLVRIVHRDDRTSPRPHPWASTGWSATGGPGFAPPARDLMPCRERLGGPMVYLVTTTTRDTHRYGYPSRQPAEVLGLLVDGSADRVAAVAVTEAVARQAPVRFLQVVPAHLDDEARSLAEEAMFRAGLHALRGHPRTQSVFEVVRNHTSSMIRSRSREAALMVVGVDQPQPGRRSLVDQCLKAAQCPVRPVPSPP
jgi:hypothetical protein